MFGGSPETYTRDLQWKCFTPVLYAMNGWSHMNKSPWSYEEPYLSINRTYLKMKMRLMPYMYKYTKEAYDTGAPIVRGMIWDNPQDKKTWGTSTQYQYMLGEWILVAPVYTSMNINKTPIILVILFIFSGQVLAQLRDNSDHTFLQKPKIDDYWFALKIT